MVNIKTHIITDSDRFWFMEALEIYLTAHFNEKKTVHYSYSNGVYSALIILEVEDNEVE